MGSESCHSWISRDKLVSENRFYSKDTSFFPMILSPSQPGWGQNLPTVSHGTVGKLRGLGGICVFPSVAHSLLSKPLPLSAAICFQPYPTGRKHEHFHHRIWLLHKFKKKERKKESNSLWLISLANISSLKNNVKWQNYSHQEAI